MKVDKQLIFIGVASFFALVLGSIGFYNHTPSNGILTAVYQTIQLFSMESGVLNDPPTPIFLEIARWIALSALLVAVYTAAQSLFGHFRSLVRISFARNHAIVCGAGHRGVALAHAFLKAGNGKVVIIDIDEHNPSLGELKNQGAEILIGNALDLTILQRSGVEKAKTLIAVTGSDEKNLAICREVESELNPACEMSAGVESWAWRSFHVNRFISKYRIDSFLCRAARNLMLELACSAARETAYQENGVRILIEAAGQARQELIRAAALMLQIAGEKKPVIELTSTTVEDEAEFLDRFPASNLAAEIIWHRQSASQVFPEGCDNKAPDFAVFALGTDLKSLEAAERYWMRHNTPDDRVVACVHGDSELDLQLPSKKTRDFVIKNLISCGLGSKDPLEPTIEEMAKTCHAIYYRNELINNPAYGTREGDLPESWKMLPERLRESNRLSAMHHEVKREVYKTKGEKPLSEVLAHLARCEHMRWIAEKAMDGWRWSGSNNKSTRDNIKLKHHLLVPFETLDSSEKDKDFNTFLWTLDIPEEQLIQLNLSEEAKRMLELAKGNQI